MKQQQQDPWKILEEQERAQQERMREIGQARMEENARIFERGCEILHSFGVHTGMMGLSDVDRLMLVGTDRPITEDEAAIMKKNGYTQCHDVISLGKSMKDKYTLYFKF